MDDLIGYAEAVIIIVLLIVIIFMMLSRKNKPNKNVKIMVNDIRKALREEHKKNVISLKQTAQLYKDLDNFIAEVPDYLKDSGEE